MTDFKNIYKMNSMEKDLQSLFAAKVKVFRLPRYNELPNVGLYLEQVVKYINGYLEPIGCPGITPSMVSNYVKKDVIPSPVKKQYYAEQIAHLIFVSIGKNVISMENITQLFKMQKETHDAETAYNYFCLELENMLGAICGLNDEVKKIGISSSQEKAMLRSVTIAVSHIIFVNNCFNELKSDEK